MTPGASFVLPGRALPFAWPGMGIRSGIRLAQSRIPFCQNRQETLSKKRLVNAGRIYYYITSLGMQINVYEYPNNLFKYHNSNSVQAIPCKFQTRDTLTGSNPVWHNTTRRDCRLVNQPFSFQFNATLNLCKVTVESDLPVVESIHERNSRL